MVIIDILLEEYCHLVQEIRDAQTAVRYALTVRPEALALTVAKIVLQDAKRPVRATVLMDVILYAVEVVIIHAVAPASIYQRAHLVLAAHKHVVHIVTKLAQWHVAKVANHAALILLISNGDKEK